MYVHINERVIDNFHLYYEKLSWLFRFLNIVFNPIKYLQIHKLESKSKMSIETNTNWVLFSKSFLYALSIHYSLILETQIKFLNIISNEIDLNHFWCEFYNINSYFFVLGPQNDFLRPV